jgi:hypothetical protein
MPGAHLITSSAILAVQGGLIFPGTRDKKVRALDEENGQVLWEAEASDAMEGIPAVYQVAGREYVVFCSAAQGKIPLPGSNAPLPLVENGAYPFCSFGLSVTKGPDNFSRARQLEISVAPTESEKPLGDTPG